MEWNRDNLVGLQLDRPWKWLLIPGAVTLWIIYMFPNPGISGVAESRRHARSPIMTIAYSVFFYFLLFFIIINAIWG